VHKTQALSSAIGTGPSGEPQGYYFVEGNPTTLGEFAVVDLRTKQTVLDVRLPAGSESSRTMGVSPADGSVYFASSDTGNLYRYRPGATSVESLGIPAPGQRMWELAVGTDGKVWGGTYPGGQLFSYDPETRAVTNYGQAVAGEQYIEAIEQVGDQIYVGTESHARLARLDLATGTFTEVAMPPDHDHTDLEELNLRGDLLFVSTDKLYVLDTTTGEWVDQRTDLSGRGVSPVDPATGNTVYYRTASGAVARYNLDTRDVQTLPWAPNATPESWAWVDFGDPNLPGQSVAFTYWNNGRTYGYNPTTGKTYFVQPALMGSGDQLTTIGAGPDGNIYAGAFLSPPGMGRFDPDRTGFELLAGSGQIEGYGSFNGDLVFGRYPQGALYRYDLDKPWNAGTNPAAPVNIGDEQNRPQGFVDLGDQVAVTSVPLTGRHGGAITLWNPDTNAVQVFRDVVTNQTPVALVKAGNLLWGGTSVNGGYGVDPVTTEARLFAWDPVTKRKVFETVPVPGKPTVAGLVATSNGHLWGLADNVLFEFDPRKRKVLETKRLFADSDESRYGNDHVLLADGDLLYGVTSHRVFSHHRRSGRTTVLYDGTAGPGAVGNLARDRYGDLYFIAKSSHLFRLDL
jgi:streptogramin lyase